MPDVFDDNYEGLAHTFQVSDYLIHKYIPDYMLIHVLTPDNIGHSKGINGEYRKAITNIDQALGALAPRWFNLGYDVIITSDHGMDHNNNHGGSKCEVVKTPLYILSKKGWDPSLPKTISHTDIAPMIIERIIPTSDFRTYQKNLLKTNNRTLGCYE